MRVRVFSISPSPLLEFLDALSIFPSSVLIVSPVQNLFFSPPAISEDLREGALGSSISFESQFMCRRLVEFLKKGLPLLCPYFPTDLHPLRSYFDLFPLTLRCGQP